MEASRPPAPIFTPVFLRLALTAFFVFSTFQGLMAVIGPYMERHGMGVAAVGVSGAVFVLTAVVVRPFVGRALDRRGRLGLYRAGFVIVALAFALYPLTATFLPLTLVRVLHGVGWGITSTAAATLIQDVVPPARRGEATGYYANFTDLAMAFGPFLAVAAFTHLGFPITSWFAAGLLLCGLLLLRPLGEPERGPAHGSRPLAVLLPSARLPALVQLLMNLNFGAVTTFLPVLAPRRGLMAPVLGVSGYAFFYLVYAATLIACRGPFGRLSDRRGRPFVIVPGLLVLSLAAGFLAVLHGVVALLVFALLFGLGFGAAQPATLAWTMDRSPRELWGSAAGTYYAAFDLGIGVASLTFGPLAAATSFRLVFLLAAAATVVAAAVVLAPWRSGNASPLPS